MVWVLPSTLFSTAISAVLAETQAASGGGGTSLAGCAMATGAGDGVVIEGETAVPAPDAPTGTEGTEGTEGTGDDLGGETTCDGADAGTGDAFGSFVGFGRISGGGNVVCVIGADVATGVIFGGIDGFWTISGGDPSATAGAGAGAGAGCKGCGPPGSLCPSKLCAQALPPNKQAAVASSTRRIIAATKLDLRTWWL